MVQNKAVIFIFILCIPLLLIGQDIKIDYSNPDNWAALPDKMDNADLVPGNYTTDKQPDSQVDVFFLYPTSFSNKSDVMIWNAAIDDKEVNQDTDERSIKNQASIFNQVGKIYAPRYRQANYAAYFDEDKINSQQAFDFAYADVVDAFEYYINHYNKGRPFIIASHSQGSTHSMRLIKEHIENTKLAKQLVVAYVVGMPVPESYLNTPPCLSPGQTGCICSWRTYLDKYEPDHVASEEKMISTNPITWDQSSGFSNKKDHKGSVLFDFDKGIYPKIMRAELHGNILWIKKPDIKGKILLQRKNYHIGDFNLFYKDVQENAKLRVDNYLNQNNSSSN